MFFRSRQTRLHPCPAGLSTCSCYCGLWSLRRTDTWATSWFLTYRQFLFHCFVITDGLYYIYVQWGEGNKVRQWLQNSGSEVAGKVHLMMIGLFMKITSRSILKAPATNSKYGTLRKRPTEEVEKEHTYSRHVRHWPLNVEHIITSILLSLWDQDSAEVEQAGFSTSLSEVKWTKD